MQACDRVASLNAVKNNNCCCLKNGLNHDFCFNNLHFASRFIFSGFSVMLVKAHCPVVTLPSFSSVEWVLISICYLVCYRLYTALFTANEHSQGSVEVIPIVWNLIPKYEKYFIWTLTEYSENVSSKSCSGGWKL